MPSAVRGRQHIWGLSGLSPLDAALCERGNRLCKATAASIRGCEAANIPWVLENPASSMLWSAPPIQRLLRRPSVTFTTIDQCQYGAPWKKATGLALGGGLSPGPHLSKVCSGRKGICSATGRPHVVLSGLRADHKGFKTLAAKEYPAPLCNAIARTFAARWREEFIATQSSRYMGR